MARGAYIAAVFAMIAAGFAAGYAALSLIPREPAALPMIAAPAPETVADREQAAAVWPDVFGVAPPPAAPAPAAPEPVISTRFGLKGLIAGRDGGWAVLTDGSAELLVQIGDTLDDGARVAQIDRHGVTLDRDGTMIRVGFAAPTDPAPGAADPAPAAGIVADLPAGAAMPEAQVELDIRDLDRRDLRRALARAGAIEQVELADGGRALDLIWIRNGQLYDRLGLQAGDRILAINGIAAGDNDAILRAAAKLLQSSEYRIELLRNGQLQAIKVKLVKNG